LGHGIRGHRTLLEVSVAAILVVILIALIAPHVRCASDDARAATLLADLQTIRARLLVYRIQHQDCFPGADFVLQMTSATNIDGETSDVASQEFRFGPYLRCIPENPFSGCDRVRIVNNPGSPFLPLQQDAGWWYNAATGEFRADLTDVHKLANGMILNSL
jgi:type II secretory pathway pseudopilin PulG